MPLRGTLLMMLQPCFLNRISALQSHNKKISLGIAASNFGWHNPRPWLYPCCQLVDGWQHRSYNWNLLRRRATTGRVIFFLFFISFGFCLSPLVQKFIYPHLLFSPLHFLAPLMCHISILIASYLLCLTLLSFELLLPNNKLWKMGICSDKMQMPKERCMILGEVGGLSF